MRLPGRCIIHGIVSDRSKINSSDQTLSNRTLTAYFSFLPSHPIFSFLLLLLLFRFHSLPLPFRLSLPEAVSHPTIKSIDSPGQDEFE